MCVNILLDISVYLLLSKSESEHSFGLRTHSVMQRKEATPLSSVCLERFLHATSKGSGSGLFLEYTGLTVKRFRKQIYKKRNKKKKQCEMKLLGETLHG